MEIRLNDIEIRKGDSRNHRTWFLKDIILKSGVVYRLTGGSGTGKSTFIDMIKNDIVKVKAFTKFIKNSNGYTGDFIINDVVARNSTMVNYQIIEQSNVFLEFLSLKKNIPSKPITDSLLERVRLLDKKTQAVKGLSGGEKRRLALVRALASVDESKDSLFIMDEPFNDLGDDDSSIIVDLLADKIDVFKTKIVIIATHDESKWTEISQKLGKMKTEIISFPTKDKGGKSVVTMGANNG